MFTLLTALIGSSEKGGTTLHRRVFGEAVESLTRAGESHGLGEQLDVWMYWNIWSRTMVS